MRILVASLLVIFAIRAHGQDRYPFEKFPAIEFDQLEEWKTFRKSDRVHFTLTLRDFFSNGDSLTIQLTSFNEKWDSSYVRLFRNKIQIQKTFESMHFNEMNVPFEPVRTLDVNGDGLTDVKLTIPTMGNGLAALNHWVIYLFQKADGLFTQISYLDKMGAHMTERDFDGDGVFEILTMTLKGHESHNYWTFNLYNVKAGEFVSQNERFGYPIMIQYLFRENYEITDKISPEEMKKFGDDKPEDYGRN